VDRCCYDLDGGEDRDRSRGFSPGDVVRLDRGAEPTMHDGAAAGLVTTEHCCLDFDGGGPADDALLVIGVPPGRVLMAAIYERRGGRGSAAAGFPLR